MHLITIYGDELYHHGIQGQKWGLRRYQNQDGTYTAEGKIRRAGFRTVDARKAALKGSARDPLGKQSYLGNKFYKKIYNKETVIRAGTKVDRVTVKSGDASEATYVIVQGDSMGRKYYDKVWPRYLQVLKNSEDPDKVQVYRDTYRVKTDIIAPDKQTRKEALRAVLDADRSLYEDIGKKTAQKWFKGKIASLKEDTLSYEIDADIRNGRTDKRGPDLFEERATISYWDSQLSTQMRSYDSAVKEAPKVYKRYANAYNDAEEITLKKVTMKDAKDWLNEEIKRYDNVAKEISSDPDRAASYAYATLPTSPKLMQAYAKELEKRGYNAAFDENTALTASAPFIVFDKNSLELESTTNITKDANDYNNGR